MSSQYLHLDHVIAVSQMHVPRIPSENIGLRTLMGTATHDHPDSEWGFASCMQHGQLTHDSPHTKVLYQLIPL